MLRGLKVGENKEKVDFYSLFQQKKVKIPKPPPNVDQHQERKPKREEWMIVPPKRIFSSDPKHKKLQKKRDKGYVELNPHYNKSLPTSTENDLNLGVNDGGRSWRNNVVRNARSRGNIDENRQSSSKIEGYRPKNISSFQRDLSYGSSFKNPFNKKRKRDNYDNDVNKRRRFEKEKKNENHMDDTSLMALDAKMRGDMKLYNKLIKKTEKKKSVPRFGENEDQNYDQEYKKLILNKRDFNEEDESVRSFSRNQKYSRKPTKRRSQKQFQTVTSRCDFCYKSKYFKKFLVVALGDFAWIGLPFFGKFIDGHCIITPFEHRMSSLHADENEYNEIQRFKKSVFNMYQTMGKDVLFLETISPFHLKKNMHFCVECIPIPQNLFEKSKMVFKRSIMEQAKEWSDNRKLIDTTGKTIRRSVPKDFPYFNVEFGFDGGFAHVIEQDSFPFRFGKDVIRGLLKMDSLENKLINTTNEVEQKKDVLKFVAQYQKFDFTYDYD